MLAPGPADEIAIVRRIYHLWTARRLTLVAIAARLNAEGVLNEQGRPWTARGVKTVLTNEKYIGNNIFGYLTRRLGGKPVRNPPETWVRVDEAFPGIVDRKLFRCLVLIFGRLFQHFLRIL